MDNIEEWEAPGEWLEKLAIDSRDAVMRACMAIATVGPNGEGVEEYLQASEKACRWCEVKHKCPAATKRVSDEIGAEFAAMDAAIVPQFAGESDELLIHKYKALAYIDAWAKAIRAELMRRISSGKPPVGPDGLPMKLVEGRGGKRSWIEPTNAVAALLQHFTPDQALKPALPITAPEAEKLLNKKLGGKKKALPTWQAVFVPLVRKSSGRPTIAYGSDEREAITTVASADEFDTGEDDGD
jgi:hypothetical protein